MIAKQKIDFLKKQLKKIAIKLKFIFLLIFLISSCNQHGDSPSEFGRKLYQAVKNKDYEKFAEVSILSNEDLTIEFSNLLAESIPKDYKKEFSQRLHANFNDIQRKLFEENISLEKMNFIGFNSYEQGSEGIYKIHRGKLIFESNQGTQTMVMRMLQKNNGKIYLIGTIELAKDK